MLSLHNSTFSTLDPPKANVLCSRQSLQWPVGLMGPSQEPLDYSCRVSSKEMGWPMKLCPLLFAAQYQRGNYEQAEASLASGFHPMMILMILYYLDTRTCADEPLPAWMVLFGVIYDEHGISIHAHYPEILHFPKDSSDPDARRWGARSYPLVSSPVDFSGWPITKRPYILGTLYRIQGHCKHVLERLKCWQGYQQACSLFFK
jgi:hypothetical protein